MAVKALVAGVADMTTKSAPQGSENTMDSELEELLSRYIEEHGNTLMDWEFPVRKTNPREVLVPELLAILKHWAAQEANQAVTSALAKHVLAGMPGLTPRQQDYITKVLAQLTDKKGKA